jgi:hypothetical protein
MHRSHSIKDVRNYSLSGRYAYVIFDTVASPMLPFVVSAASPPFIADASGLPIVVPWRQIREDQVHECVLDLRNQGGLLAAEDGNQGHKKTRSIRRGGGICHRLPPLFALSFDSRVSGWLELESYHKVQEVDLRAEAKLSNEATEEVPKSHSILSL